MTGDESAERAVLVPADSNILPGDLTVPEGSRGIVVFAHGSGSSRHSTRNRRVAAALQQAGYATLLMDLLTDREEAIDVHTREFRFDIPRLAARLTGAVDWLAGQPSAARLTVATFGASTGAAAALITAADRPERVHLVISRGGRPDLAGDALARVHAPTLLIVGGNDPEVLRLNEQAATQLAGNTVTAVVPGATHLFEEPGTLDVVIELAIQVLDRYLGIEPLHK
jgi:dienelactone hydrolase